MHEWEMRMNAFALRIVPTSLVTEIVGCPARLRPGATDDVPCRVFVAEIPFPADPDGTAFGRAPARMPRHHRPPREICP
jgi:hypothetical protein